MSDAAAESTVVDAEPARPVGPEAQAPRSVQRPVHRGRFAAVYLVLAVLAGGAIGSFVVLVAGPDPASPPQWSAFQPEGSASARVHQIVNTIPQKYRRADGSQLVSVSVSAPQAPVVGQDGQTVVPVNVHRIAFEEGGDFRVVETGDALQYTLCGNGQDCEIDTGPASIDRYVLVQRQALELALYTFKYVEDVGSVTVLLPPSFVQNDDGTTRETRRTALFLQRSDVERELSRPLSATLGVTTPGIGETDARDQEAIRRISVPHVYAYSLTQAQDGAFMLVLRPELRS